MTAEPLRALYFDIENSPMLVKAWDNTPGYIPPEAIVHDKFLYCWSAQWLGEKKIITDQQTQDEVLAWDDSRIVKTLSQLANEADIVIGHNVDKHDIAILRSRVAFWNQTEVLKPLASIDTRKLAVANFNVGSRSLDYLAGYFGLQRKKETPKGLNDRVYSGEKDAMRLMVAYNRQDIRVGVDVFNHMRRHVKKIARMVDGGGCPNCGSFAFQYRGYARSNAQSYRQRQCNECDRYYREQTVARLHSPAGRVIA